jgi:hypothetical protein
MILPNSAYRVLIAPAALLVALAGMWQVAGEEEILSMKSIVHASDKDVRRPTIDAQAPQHLETATFAMG